MAVRDIDRGYDRLIKRLEELGGGVKTTIGIHADAGAESHPGGGGSVVEVGLLAEFGTVDQPPRSFLRSTFDENVAALERGMVRAAELAARGEADIKGSFGVLGLELRDQMLEKMGETAPLDEDTIEQRGEDTPLDASGTLREAMRVQVNRVEVG